jgi:hypothetical protein
MPPTGIKAPLPPLLRGSRASTIGIAYLEPRKSLCSRISTGCHSGYPHHNIAHLEESKHPRLPAQRRGFPVRPYNVLGDLMALFAALKQRAAWGLSPVVVNIPQSPIQKRMKRKSTKTGFSFLAPFLCIYNRDFPYRPRPTPDHFGWVKINSPTIKNKINAQIPVAIAPCFK